MRDSLRSKLLSLLQTNQSSVCQLVEIFCAACLIWLPLCRLKAFYLFPLPDTESNVEDKRFCFLRTPRLVTTLICWNKLRLTLRRSRIESRRSGSRSEEHTS